MTSPVQLVLMVTPLAAYLYLVAIWQTGRHPRVVTGPVDLWLLALGVSGLVLAGPVGQLLVRTIFGRPGPLQWLVLGLVAFLVVGRLARRSSRRLVVYHVGAESLDAALRDCLGPDAFIQTVGGYESRTESCGIRVEHSPRWHSTVVDGFGQGADALIATLGPQLARRLRQAPAATPDVALLFFALPALTMLIPLAGHLLTQPRTRAVLRVLLQRLYGG
jgi:hypothetical protein